MKPNTLIAGSAIVLLALGGCRRDRDLEGPVDRDARAEPEERAEPPTEAPDADDQARAQPDQPPRIVIVPTEIVGHGIAGTAMVDEVVSDQAFWITDGHSRMLVAVPPRSADEIGADRPMGGATDPKGGTEPLGDERDPMAGDPLPGDPGNARLGEDRQVADLQPGDVVYLEGLVLDREHVRQITDQLDPEARRAAETEPYLLVTADRNVRLLPDQTATADRERRRAGRTRVPTSLVEEHVVSRLDRAGDGEVTREEFLSGAPNLGVDLDLDGDGDYADDFLVLDFDDDGVLTAEEIARGLSLAWTESEMREQLGMID